MKKLNIRFSETQRLKISDIGTTLDLNSSDIARVAMELGLMQIQEIASRDIKSAKEVVAINAFKAKQ